MSRPSLRTLTSLALIGLAGLLVGCGGGGGGHVESGFAEVIVVPPLVGDVEVDNQTDLSESFEDLYGFEMAPALTDFWTGNLLPDIVFPGETLYVGTFDEDLYDAVADLDLGFVDFFDIFVEAGFTTTFEVY